MTLISTHLLGLFIVKLKIGFFGALFVTFPLIAVQNLSVRGAGPLFQ